MLLLDIEAIPAIRATDPRYAAITEMASQRRAHHHEGRQTAEEFQALCPLFARPVAIALWNLNTRAGRVGYDAGLLDVSAPLPGGWVADACLDEPALLRWAHSTLVLFDAPGRPLRLVTFAGRRYDLPLLFHRAKVHGLEPASIVARSLWQKPWEREPHLDLLDYARFGGAMERYSLRAHALAYGGADPKAEVEGSAVDSLVAARDGGAVLRYVCGDVGALAYLLGRIMAIETLDT